MAKQQEQTKRHTKFDEKAGKIQQNLKTSFDKSAIMPDRKEDSDHFSFQQRDLCY